jgi:hypothetical protein
MRSASFCADGQSNPNKGQVADEIPAASAKPKGGKPKLVADNDTAEISGAA